MWSRPLKIGTDIVTHLVAEGDPVGRMEIIGHNKRYLRPTLLRSACGSPQYDICLKARFINDSSGMQPEVGHAS